MCVCVETIFSLLLLLLKQFLCVISVSVCSFSLSDDLCQCLSFSLLFLSLFSSSLAPLKGLQLTLAIFSLAYAKVVKCVCSAFGICRIALLAVFSYFPFVHAVFASNEHSVTLGTNGLQLWAYAPPPPLPLPLNEMLIDCVPVSL